MFNFIKQGIMKRVFNFRTILVLAVLLFSANGMFGQILTDYQNVAENSYQTAGMTFRLYVLPDPIYSPLYVAATNTGIDASARWTWTYAGIVTGAPATGVATNQNYVEFTSPVVGGPFTIGVTESNTLGGCAGAVVNQVVNVIAPPTAVIFTADPAQACGNQAAMAVAMTFTENVPAAFASYAFVVDELVENIDPSNTVLGTVSHNATFVNFPTGGKLKAPALTGAVSPYGYSFNTSALAVAGAKRTRYTYTLKSAAGVTGTGVVSAISQKSDYLTLPVITGYAFGAKTTFVAIVNPAPVTGPIYHIPNSFAY
jgi:hypothetical protein